MTSSLSRWPSSSPNVDLRDEFSWFETKPLFGWKVLVPRTQAQAGSMVDRLERLRRRPPTSCPTISVEPPRTPQQMEKAVKGLVTGRYEWIGFTSVNAVARRPGALRGVRARRPRLRRAQGRGRRWRHRRRAARLGHQPRPRARAREQSAAGPARGVAALRRGARPDQPRAPAARRHRHRDARRRAARHGLGGRRRHGLPHRARRSARRRDPRRDQGRRLRRRRLHVELDGAQPRRHRRQAAPATVVACIGPATAKTAQEHGLRVDVLAPEASAVSLVDALAGHGVGRWRVAAAEAGQPVRRPSEKRPTPAPPRPLTRTVADGDRASPPPAPDAGPARARRRDAAAPARARAARLRRRGHRRAAADLGDAGRRRSTPSTRSSAEARRCVDAGLGGIMLFGVPATRPRTPTGTGAVDADDGILNVALRAVARRGRRRPRRHGRHVPRRVHRPRPLRRARRARPGRQRRDHRACMPRWRSRRPARAPTSSARRGMMDGQVAVIREALDEAGFTDTVILAYAAKYASAFYGPFREAVQSEPAGRPPRPTSRTRPTSSSRSARSTSTSPRVPTSSWSSRRMSYLDVVARPRRASSVPVAAYQVSGEYAMIKAAAEQRLDRPATRAVLESLTVASAGPAPRSS